MNGITCAFTGRLGGDAELRYTAQGRSKASFSVAIDDYQRGKEGTDQPAPTWARVTIWEADAERLVDQLRKGVEVYVKGRLRLEVWTGKDGEQRASFSVSASRIEVLGRIGRLVTERASADEAGVAVNEDQR